jgi:outer membrane murein-binding lipoprotein Lpp
VGKGCLSNCAYRGQSNAAAADHDTSIESLGRRLDAGEQQQRAAARIRKEQGGRASAATNRGNMTVEERLKMLIGDLVISRCALETRIEELDVKVKELEAKVEQPSMFKQAVGDDVYSHREHASALRGQEIKQAAE